MMLLAGEPSGDHHAAALAASIRTRLPEVRFVGTGGDHMRARGVRLLADLGDLAVMGFVEIIPRIPFFRRLARRIEEVMDTERPDVVVLVDYPGFNMRMARAASDRGIPVLYYIAPKVWAWKEGRAKKLARTTDRVAVILPFEREVLANYGVDATYVGNPLLDRPDDVPPREVFLSDGGLPDDRPILAVLPGSRRQELKHHLDAFRAIAERVVEHRPDVLPVFSRAEGMSAVPYHELGFPVVTDTRALLRYASAALVKSGTATLETVLEDTPFVIAYRSSPLTMAIGLRLLRAEHFGLPNLVADARVIPEFKQDEVRPETIAPLLVDLLDEEGEARGQQLDELARVRAILGEPGASDRVAALVAEMIEPSTGPAS